MEHEKMSPPDVRLKSFDFCGMFQVALLNVRV